MYIFKKSTPVGNVGFTKEIELLHSLIWRMKQKKILVINELHDKRGNGVCFIVRHSRHLSFLLLYVSDKNVVSATAFFHKAISKSRRLVEKYYIILCMNSHAITGRERCRPFGFFIFFLTSVCVR